MQQEREGFPVFLVDDLDKCRGEGYFPLCGKDFADVTLHRKILAGAVVLAFSTLATAQDIEGVQTETIADNTPIANTTLNLKDNAEFTVTGVTNQFGLLNNSPVKGENATLILKAKGTGNINAALGDGGSDIKVNRVEITSEERAAYSSNWWVILL